MVLDLKAGSVFGAAIGMNETAARTALGQSNIRALNKQVSRDGFILQSPSAPGLVYHFDTTGHLFRIYSNSDQLLLSNGLKVGSSVTSISSRLGAPAPAERLPSGVGFQHIYKVGAFELVVICVKEKPQQARAYELRAVPSAPPKATPPVK